MTRQEIIEQAKNYLPPFDEYPQPSIIIKIIDIDASAIPDEAPLKKNRDSPYFQEIEFLKCYVSENGVEPISSKNLSEKQELAWVPKEYLDLKKI